MGSCVVCLRWLISPAKSPSNIPLLVLLRTLSLLLTLSSTVLMCCSILLRPWKLQEFRGDRMEIGVWTICRVTSKVNHCYDDWYSQHPIWWFTLWRTLMVSFICLQLVNFLYLVVELVRRKPKKRKPWITGGLINIVAGAILFLSLVVFYMKFEWEWAEMDFGWPIMGWNEATPDAEGFLETAGYPYIMAWVAVVICFITGYVCYYTCCQEMLYNDRT